jgi:hypothetical protein
MEPGKLKPSNKPAPGWFRRRLSKIPKRLPESVRRRFRDLNKETLEGRQRPLPKSFDTSGKSPAY